MSEKGKCFIIQPLTPEYKKRSEETYKPAIQKAGLAPYRVDEDYNAEKLKIQMIREEIEKSVVCLAEISEDNPNVWYELGFADGHDVPVVLICEMSKRNKLPFDVNQRDTYFYRTDSQGDWEKLQKEITERLHSVVSGGKPAKKGKDSVTKDSSSDESEFGQIELVMLRILYYYSEDDQSLKEESRLKERMLELGFSKWDITDAFNKLKSERMIHISGANYAHEKYCYSLTEEGTKWCLENKEKLRGRSLLSILKRKP